MSKFFIIVVLGLFIFGGIYISTIKIAENEVKRIELLADAFKNKEMELFCKDRIVSIKNGWSLEGIMLIKQDNFYNLRDCSVKHQ